MELLLALGLGVVQQKDLLLLGHDVICIHLPSQRADRKQDFTAQRRSCDHPNLPEDSLLSKGPDSRMWAICLTELPFYRWEVEAPRDRACPTRGKKAGVWGGWCPLLAR